MGISYDSPSGIIAATVVTQVLALLSVGLRFYSRRWKRQKFIISDWFILAALFIGAGLAAMEIYGVHKKALGYPIGVSFSENLMEERFAILKEINLALTLLGVAGTGCVKLSVCFLYWHLFSRAVFRRFLVVWIGIVALWTVGFLITGFFQCGTRLWAVLGSAEDYFTYCQAAVPAGYALMASDVLTDLITLTIPIPVIISLRFDLKTKLLTLLIFMIGSLSVGAAIAKTYVYIIMAMGQYTEDAMLTNTGLSVWNLMEVQIGIIAACGPTLRQVLARAIHPTTTTIRSLISRLGSAASRTGSSSRSRSNQGSNTGGNSANRPQQFNNNNNNRGELELPSFVKIPEGSSLEQLHSPGVMHVARVHAHGGKGAAALTDITMSSRADSSENEDYEMTDFGRSHQPGTVTVTRNYDVKSGDSMV